MGVRGELREPMMKKLVLLPFSIGCASQASVAVLEQRGRRSRLEFKSSSLSKEEAEEEEGRTLGESLRHSSRFSRPNLTSNGVSRLIKGFKNLSLLFNDDEIEELDMDEFEIGCPTDVKHVTHIGWNDLVPSSPAVSLIHHFQLPTTSPTPTLQNHISTFEKPRDGIEKMALVPVTASCISEDNIVEPVHTLRRSKSDLTSSSSLRNQLMEEEGRESIGSESMRHSTKPNLSTGVNRLMKGFKNLSQLFVYEDEMKEISMEMEIGCPTDVKHVTHIGSDGLANVNPSMEWDKLIIPELLSHSHTASVVSFNKFSVSSTTSAVA